MLQMTCAPRSALTSHPPVSAPRIVYRRVSPPCSSARAYIEDDLYPYKPWAMCKFDVTVKANVPLSLGFLGEETKSGSRRWTHRDGRYRCSKCRPCETAMHAGLRSAPRPALRDQVRDPRAQRAGA